MKSSEVSIKTRSTPASLTIQGQVTKDTTVKWSIDRFYHIFTSCDFFYLFSLFFHVGSVVPVNAIIRLSNEEWNDGLSNTTSEAFMNLSRKLETNVSFQ